MTTVVVFGGSGFLGWRLVRRLASDGLNVRVVVRHPAAARSILKAAGLDQVTVQRADVCDQASVAAAVAGAEFTYLDHPADLPAAGLPAIGDLIDSQEAWRGTSPIGHRRGLPIEE